jgi:hypothetical protein
LWTADENYGVGQVVETAANADHSCCDIKKGTVICFKIPAYLLIIRFITSSVVFPSTCRNSFDESRYTRREDHHRVLKLESEKSATLMNLHAE